MNMLVVFLVTLVVVLVAAHLRRGDVPEPAERRQWVVDEFARRKLRQWLLVIPIGAVLAVLQWAKRHPDEGLMTLVVPAAVVVALGSAWFSYRNWRCPACGAYLGKYAWMQGRCPKCHTALR